MNTYPNLYYLQYFLDAVELGSVSAAAKRNRISHSAVSRAISTLELQLGLSLLNHQKKSFDVTDIGLRTAEQARVLLKNAALFQSSELETALAYSGTIILGLSRSLENDWLPDLLKELKARFPLLRMQIKYGTTNELTGEVAKGQIDFALTVGTQSLPTVDKKVLKKGNFVLIEGGSRKQIRSGIEGKTFILTEPRVETEILKKRYSEQFGSELTLFCELSSWTGIVNLVRTNIAVGLVPDFAIRSLKASELHVLKAHWYDCDYTVYIHFSKKTSHKRPVAYAIEYLRGPLSESNI
jgi:DNA-binding transcriptional LysR family regulator